MTPLDPSYIRSIRDGILTEKIEANNNEALPDGLVGLYDQELFPPTLKWKERKETLDFFLVFALAQKEISADFAAEILGDDWFMHADENFSREYWLQRVSELIQVHSKRFSSAGGGKYRLYHERFRVYVLQKVAEQDIAQFNARFIALCESAELETNSEKKSYALEFISSHFFISAMQGEKDCLNIEHASSLKKYAYDQQFWEYQIKASNGFEWSKKMLKRMMSWVSKFKEDDEVIMCALNKVDLYHQEQKDAPRIIELIDQGEIETAMGRINRIKGDNELQCRFILYMWTLIKLTEMDGQNNGEAQVNIESVLKDIEKHIPIDQKIFNWGEFYPSSFMFQFAHKLRARNLDYVTLYNRTGSWDYSWMLEYKLNYTEDDYLVLEKIFQNFHVNPSNHKTQMEIDIHVDIAFKNYELFADKFEHNGYRTREKFALGVCDAFLKRNELIRAHELAKMTRGKMRTSLLIRIAMHCIENNDYNQVVTICQTITYEETKFDELLKVHEGLYNRGFDALHSAQQILFIIQEHVENTYLDRLPNRIPKILKAMIKYPGRHGLDIFERYDQHGIQFSSDLMADIAIKYIELENLTTAFEVFDRCGETLNYGKKLEFHIRVVESTNPEIIPNIDENYGEYFLGSNQQIETIINEIAQEQLTHYNVTYYLIPNLRLLWNAGLNDLARQLLKIIENAVEDLDNALDRGHCYYDLAREVIYLNLIDNAMNLINNVVAVGWKIELYLLCSDKLQEVNQVNIENNDIENNDIENNDNYFIEAYNIWVENEEQHLPQHSQHLGLRNLIKHQLKWNEPRTITNLMNKDNLLPIYSNILIDELLISNNVEVDDVNTLLKEFDLLNHLNSRSLIELFEYYFKNNLEQRALGLLERIPLQNDSFQIYLKAIEYNFDTNLIDEALLLSQQVQKNCHTLSRYEYGVQLSTILRRYNYEQPADNLLECMLTNAIERKHFEHLTSIVNELYIPRNMYEKVKEIAQRIYAQDNLTATDKKQCLKLIDFYNVHAPNPEIMDILQGALIVTSELKSEDKNNILKTIADQFMLNGDLTNALYIAKLLSTDSKQKFINEKKNALLTVNTGHDFILENGSDQDKADLARHRINEKESKFILPVLDKISEPKILLAIWKEYVDFLFANPIPEFGNYQQHFNIASLKNKKDVKIKVLFYLSEKFYEDHNFILARKILKDVKVEINCIPLVGNGHETALQQTKLLITLANRHWTQNDIENYKIIENDVLNNIRNFDLADHQLEIWEDYFTILLEQNKNINEIIGSINNVNTEYFKHNIAKKLLTKLIPNQRWDDALTLIISLYLNPDARCLAYISSAKIALENDNIDLNQVRDLFIVPAYNIFNEANIGIGLKWEYNNMFESYINKFITLAMQNENEIQEQEDVARKYLDYDFYALNRHNPIPSQMEYAMKKPNYIKLYIYLADIGSQLALRFVEKKATPFNYHVFEETMLSIVEKYIMNNNYDYCVQAFSSGQLTNDSRRKIWEKIGRLIYERYNLLGAMQMLTNFKDPIAINYIRKAIIQSELSNLEPDFITLLKIPDVELPDTKRILTYYVIRELFFENQQYILNENRYNRTLNLQWAIDIKNQWPN